MKIEHLAIWTHDLDGMCRFYATYFGAVAGPLYKNPLKGFQSRFLSFQGGARLELMFRDGMTVAPGDLYTEHIGLAHFALSLGSADAVDMLTLNLTADGYEKLDGPRWTGDGYYEALFLDPEGNRLEITI